jgi:hypothetical protein
MASGKHQAYIVQVEGQFKVRPAVASLEKGQHRHFSICNVSEWPAKVKVDSAMLAPGESALQEVANGYAVSFLLGNRNRSKAFTYEVSVNLDGVELPVHGESDPVIIIDP